MQTIRTLALLSVVSFASLAMPLGGCEQKADSPTTSKPATGAGAPTKADNHVHKNDEGHDHGVTTQLGEQNMGGFTIKASRDGGITPGKEAAIDVWVTGGASKVAAVRFWIGTQDGKGSVKAKAELEKDNWHTHAEVPSPLPTGSKLWVEIESEKSEKTVVGFDLKV